MLAKTFPMSKRFSRSLFACSLALLIFPVTARAQEASPATPPSPAATPTPVPTLEAPNGMVYVAPGPFQMGTNDTGGIVPGDQSPQHEVTLPAFFIDKTEVSNAQYKKYCDDTKYPMPPDWLDGKIPAGQENWPVLRVNWWEASAYAKWAGRRLPTEAEWEKAARGTDARQYPWGNGGFDGDHVAVGADPSPVGSKPSGASPYGALDMAGNAYEWTDSWYEAYPKSTSKTNFFGHIFKVVRGGSYDGSGNLAQTFFRSPMRPQSRNVWVGFRCAKSL